MNDDLVIEEISYAEAQHAYDLPAGTYGFALPTGQRWEIPHRGATRDIVEGPCQIIFTIKHACDVKVIRGDPQLSPPPDAG